MEMDGFQNEAMLTGIVYPDEQGLLTVDLEVEFHLIGKRYVGPDRRQVSLHGRTLDISQDGQLDCSPEHGLPRKGPSLPILQVSHIPKQRDHHRVRFSIDPDRGVDTLELHRKAVKTRLQIDR